MKGILTGLILTLIYFPFVLLASDIVIREDIAKSTGFSQGGGYPSAYENNPNSLIVKDNCYGSWNGDDKNTGRLETKSFILKDILTFSIAGNPWSLKNRLFLKDDLGNTLPLPIKFRKYYHHHTKIQWVLPTLWQKRAASLIVIDADKSPMGWTDIYLPILHQYNKKAINENEEYDYLASYHENNHFKLNGQYTDESRNRKKTSDKIIFGSWAGNDSHKSLSFSEWFIAPEYFMIGVCGTPNEPNIAVMIQNEDFRQDSIYLGTQNAHSLDLLEVQVITPKEFIGQKIRLIVIDSSDQIGGWIGITPPYLVSNDAIATPLDQVNLINEVLWRSQGSFRLNGYPNDMDHSIDVKKWREKGINFYGSYLGSDSNIGSIKSPFFRASGMFKVFVAGTPMIKDKNSILLFNKRKNSEIAIHLKNSYHSNHWTPVIIKVPNGWENDPLQIRAIDDSKEWGGWIGVSTPFVGVSTIEILAYHIDHSLIKIILKFSFIYLLTLFPGIAIVSLLFNYVDLKDYYLIPLALLMTGVIGYLFFFLYFLDLRVGRYSSIFLYLFLFSSILYRSIVKRRFDFANILLKKDVSIPISLIYFISLLYISIAALTNTAIEDRFLWNMPGDNVIPEIIATSWFQGNYIRDLMGDWLVSDRPPLQSGIYLISEVIWNPIGNFSTYIGVLVQGFWISAVYLLFKILNTAQKISTYIFTGMICSGFILFNSTFVWPKLIASAFIIIAVAMIFDMQKRNQSPNRSLFIFIGIALALGFLSHGGVAFSIPILLLFVFFYCAKHKEYIGSFMVIGSFLLLYSFWPIFQRSHAPPGNRLLKMHIAGEHKITESGLVETFIKNSQKKGFNKMIQNKLSNIRILIDIPAFLSFDPLIFRKSQFFNLFNTLDILLLGIPVFLYNLFRDRRIEYFQLLLIVIGGLLIWVTLMFRANSCIIHQGSYVTVILLYIISLIGLYQLNPWLRYMLLFIHMLLFSIYWIVLTPANAPLYLNIEEIDISALFTVIISLIGISFVLLRPLHSLKVNK